MIREILAVLFPCIVILYFIDSIQFINTTHLLFVNHFGKKYHLKKNGFHISKLSPIGTTILSHDMPVCFTAGGLYTIHNEESFEKVICEADDFYFISYQDIDTVEVNGKEIRINGKKHIKAPSSISANGVQGIIEEIKTTPPDLRTERIEKLFEETLDIGNLETLNRSCSDHLTNLKILSSFLFINSLIILPLILYSTAYLFINIYLIATYIILAYIITLVMTIFVHMKVYKIEKKQRLSVVLSMIFSPVSAMHAVNYITPDLYARFHYLAIAKLFLTPDTFIGLVRKELLLIEYRKRAIDDPDWFEYWELKEKSIMDLIEKAGYTRKSVLAAPAKQDENATCYCSVCRAEYIVDIEKCSDCGIALEKF